jgi:hypothetical protein
MKFLLDYIPDVLNSKIKNNKYIIGFSLTLLVLLFFVLIIIFFLVISYYIIKYLEINVVKDIYFCNYSYNKQSEDLLKKYGTYKINKIYLVKNPITNFTLLLLNLITFYNFEKALNNFNKDNKINELSKKKYMPYHISLIVEINLPNNNRKFLLVEKTSYVNITENIHLNDKNVIKIIKLPKKNFTLNTILKETQKRIGDNKFFNWSIYKNNCSVFIKEILLTIGLFNKSNIKFVNQEKIVKHLKFSNFTLHIINILCTINNIFDNYMFMR